MVDKNRGNKEYYALLKDYIDTKETGTSAELNHTPQKKRLKKPSKRIAKTNYSQVIASISNSENSGRRNSKNSIKSSTSTGKPTFSVTELVKQKLEKKNAEKLKDSSNQRKLSSNPALKENIVKSNENSADATLDIKLNKQNTTSNSKIETTNQVRTPAVAIIDNQTDDESSDDDFDEDDFEDVSINPDSVAIKDITQDDSVSVTINLKKSSKQRNSLVITKEHRLQRKRIHMMYIACILLHGRQLNCRLNNKHLQSIYSKIVPKSIYCELHPNIKKKGSSNLVKSRYFLDGLRHLMELWIKKFRITFATGVFKLNWNEIETDKYKSDVKKCLNNDTKMNRSFYFNCLANFNGNRDMGAQAFVALLRSVQVKTRLVFSIQPPNFTITAPISKIQEEKAMQKSNVDRIPKFGAGKSTSKSLLQKISNSTHGGSNKINETFHLEKILKKNPYLSPYPIFWAEAWNPFIQRWISIDALNFRILENIQKVSKLEPPLNDDRNSLLYVVAFDRSNNLKDVTRRYAAQFNSKTRKKRITRDNAGYKWFEDVISKISTNSITGKNVEIDKLEDEYLMDKSLKEGMPTSISDFRNHPIYVLESQLKPNEIIIPKDACGYVRTGNGKTSSLPVYLRQNVHELRSSVGWFHKGRTIKIGERALRRKAKKSKQGIVKSSNISSKQDRNTDAPDDDDDLRLYAEFQTELYAPEPIRNGKVPKNGFGNIDIYTESMIPEGGVWMKLKFAAQAAKIINIDYAPAVSGFKFGYRNTSKPKIEGIVIAKEFEEAVQLVNDNLQEEDVVKQRKSAMAKALRAWSLVFAKLRIVDRLNSDHGKIEEDSLKQSENKYDEFILSSDGEEYPYNENEVVEEEEEVTDKLAYQEVYGGGGFLPTDMDQEALQKQARKDLELHRKRISEAAFSDTEENNYHTSKRNKHADDTYGDFYIPEDNQPLPDGGFIPEDNVDNQSLPDGGFIPEDNVDNQSLPDGGFIPEDNVDNQSLPNGGFIPEDNVDNEQSPDGGFILGDNVGNEQLSDSGFIPERIFENDSFSSDSIKLDGSNIIKNKVSENPLRAEVISQNNAAKVIDDNNSSKKERNSNEESLNNINENPNFGEETATSLEDSTATRNYAETMNENTIDKNIAGSISNENEEFEELEDEEGGFEYEDS